jgi:glycosyltransferase involved in cell wall biosynthesis
MNPENKRTLIILTPGFPASETDTTCLPMQQSLVRSINKNYPELEVIVLSFQYPYVSKTYKWFDTTVMSFSGKNKGGIKRFLLRRKIMTRLKVINHSKNIAGLLSFWYGECAWVGNHFTIKNNSRHFCWLLGQDARAGNKYARASKLKAGELIALSDFIQDEFESNYGIKPQQVVPPGIDVGLFGTNEPQKDIDIIATGSLIALKQFNVFVKLIAEIRQQLPFIKAVLVGGGPEKNKLQSLIDSYALGTNLKLAGELPHPEVLQYMRRAKLFLHTSSYEGFGVVCLEALHAGCHVISFCKPMKQDIRDWHIADTAGTMKEKALALLKENTSYNSKTPFLIQETTEKIMSLFKIAQGGFG